MPGDPDPAFGPEHLGVAADRSALAAILDAQGRHGEAMVPLREALVVMEALLGRDHYEVAVMLGTLGGVAERAGHAEEAAALYERALVIQRRILGADHADVVETVRRLRALDLGASASRPGPKASGRKPGRG